MATVSIDNVFEACGLIHESVRKGLTTPLDGSREDLLAMVGELTCMRAYIYITEHNAVIFDEIQIFLFS